MATVATPGKDYVVGKGRVYFDIFADGTKTPTGERYLGNTPEFNISQDQSTLDHYDSDSGLNVKDESVVTEQNMTGSLITDNISPENIALWFGAELADTVITSQTAVVYNAVDVKRGHYIQIGVSEALPTGHRNVAAVVVKVGSTTVTPLNNYEVDLERGRIYIEPDSAAIADGADLEITFNVTAGTRQIAVGKGTTVAGALRFISDNPIGSQKDYFFPYVKLAPNGDFALKGDEWQQIPFAFEALKKDANTERVYIEAR